MAKNRFQMKYRWTVIVLTALGIFAISLVINALTPGPLNWADVWPWIWPSVLTGWLFGDGVATWATKARRMKRYQCVACGLSLEGRTTPHCPACGESNSWVVDDLTGLQGKQRSKKTWTWEKGWWRVQVEHRWRNAFLAGVYWFTSMWLMGFLMRSKYSSPLDLDIILIHVEGSLFFACVVAFVALPLAAVSDRKEERRCVHCGYDLDSQRTLVCSECGHTNRWLVDDLVRQYRDL